MSADTVQGVNLYVNLRGEQAMRPLTLLFAAM